MTVKPIIFHADGISRGAGQSTAGSMAYALGKNYRDSHYQKTCYGRKRTDLVHDEIMLPPEAPSEYYDYQTFLDAWNASEKRCDAQMAHTYIMALPNELDSSEWIELARSFARENFVNEGFPVFYAVHVVYANEHPKPAEIPVAGDCRDNPHIHMMCSFRPVDADGFCSHKAKGRETQRLRFLYQVRKSWAEWLNRSFERLGVRHQGHSRQL